MTDIQEILDHWRNKTVLLVSPEGWGPSRVSKHHYAESLVNAGAHVYFLGPPEPKQTSFEVCHTDTKNLFQLRQPSYMRGIRFLPHLARRHLTQKRLSRITEQIGANIDVIWNFDLYQFADLDGSSTPRYQILQVMDVPPSYSWANILPNYPYVFSVAEKAASTSQELGFTCHRIPHGLASGDLSFRPSLSPVSVPRIGYFGNFAKPYIDWVTLQQVVAKVSEAEFYFVGPWGGSQLGGNTVEAEAHRQQLAQFSNVTIVGPVPWQQLEGWMAAMDMLLITERASEFADEVAHPHKMLEYLNSGNAIVSTPAAAFKDLSELVCFADQGLPYVEAVQRTIGSLQELKQQKQERRDYARARTYRNVLAHVTSLLFLSKPVTLWR